MADLRNGGNEGNSNSASGNAGHPCLRCGGSAEGKNLVVCIDGTSNKFSINNTNIVELYRHLKSDDSQLTYYNSGIGTHARPSFRSARYWRQAISHNIDLAFAWKFEKIVIGAYRWLADNYRNGDRIYLFGFSRGAYQVRVLSAMIDKVGLIRRGNEEQIPFAFELYAGLPAEEDGSDSESGEDVDTREKKTPRKRRKANSSELFNFMKQSSNSRSPDDKDAMAKVVVPGKERSQPTGSMKVTEDSEELRLASVEPAKPPGPDLISDVKRYSDRDPVRLARTFKRTFCRDSVKAHFVGVWDTVSSVGIVRDKVHPHTANGMHHTCFFRHALALDERRVKFLPEYVYGGTALPRRAPSEDPRQPYTKERPHVKEVWFRGSHSDIGGGNAENVDLNRGDPPLRWMSYEAIQAGLLMSTFEGSKNEGWDKFRIKRSMRGIWWALELLPLRRLSYRDSRETTWTPHLGQGRIIKPGQLIHSTVIRAENPETDKGYKNKKRYKPRAFLPLELRDWDDYRGSERNPKKEPFIKVELDLMNVSEILVTRLRGGLESKVVLKELENALKSAEHSRALYDLTQLSSSMKDNKPKKDKLSEAEKPMSEVLSESFQHVIKDILKPFTSKLTSSISISITPDIRLYALCVRVLSHSQAVPVSDVRVRLNTGSNGGHGEGDADIHFSINRDSQKLEISFMGPEFSRGEQGELVSTCAVDNTKAISAVLRRASQFYNNLRCTGMAIEEGKELPEAEFSRKTVPVAGKRAIVWKVRDDKTPIRVGTLLDGYSWQALYNSVFYNRDRSPMYPYLFEFGAGLAFGSVEPDIVELPVPPNEPVRMSDLHFDPWGGNDIKKVSFHKVVWTNKEVPALKHVPFVSIDRVIDLGAQAEEWKPIPNIPNVLAEAGVEEWFAQQYMVMQDDMVLQDSLDMVDLGPDDPPPSPSAVASVLAPPSPSPVIVNVDGSGDFGGDSTSVEGKYPMVLPNVPSSPSQEQASSWPQIIIVNGRTSDEEGPQIQDVDASQTRAPKMGSADALPNIGDMYSPRSVVDAPKIGDVDASALAGEEVKENEDKKSSEEAPTSVGRTLISYVGHAIGMFSG